MPRPQLTEDEVASFRRHAAVTALEMVEESGAEALTLRGLAARIGCSCAKPYRYFRDKGQLVDAVRGQAFNLLRDAMAAEVLDYDESSLQQMARVYVQFALEHREIYRVLFEMNQENISKETRAAQAEAWAVCSWPFRHAVANGVLAGDPELIAHIAWASLHGLVSLELAGQLYLGKNIDEIAASLAVILDGFRPDRSSTS